MFCGCSCYCGCYVVNLSSWRGFLRPPPFSPPPSPSPPPRLALSCLLLSCLGSCSSSFHFHFVHAFCVHFSCFLPLFSMVSVALAHASASGFARFTPCSDNGLRQSRFPPVVVDTGRGLRQRLLEPTTAYTSHGGHQPRFTPSVICTNAPLRPQWFTLATVYTDRRLHPPCFLPRVQSRSPPPSRMLSCGLVFWARFLHALLLLFASVFHGLQWHLLMLLPQALPGLRLSMTKLCHPYT